MGSAFWDRHQEGLKDPEYARAFAAESIRIATVDAIMNSLSTSLEETGLTKADLARAVGQNDASIRRLLSESHAANPTLGTLAEVAGALGLKVTLSPMSAAERKAITEPMVKGARMKGRSKAGRSARSKALVA